MKKLMVGVLAAFAAAVGFAETWTYDSSAGTISDGTSTLKVSASGTDLTLKTGHTAVGAVLDFSQPITDGEGTSYSIVKISYDAFNGKKAITKVVYPNTLRTIEGQAFSGCSGITLVEPALVPDFITSFNTIRRAASEYSSAND